MKTRADLIDSLERSLALMRMNLSDEIAAPEEDKCRARRKWYEQHICELINRIESLRAKDRRQGRT